MTSPNGAPVDVLRPQHLVTGHLNVLVFGPGVGEAIVLVFPDGSLGIVDGCREPRNDVIAEGDPVREFIAQLPQPLRIRFVCITHPHDDHYKGIARLIRAHTSSINEIWTPAIAGPKFRKELDKYENLLLGLTSKRRTLSDSGIRGYSRVLDEIDRARRKSVRLRPILDAHRIIAEPDLGGALLEIHSVAPFGNDTFRAQDSFARALRERSGTFDPNIASIALLIKWGNAHVLLSGDYLCQPGESMSGWSKSMEEIERVGFPVQLVKVAHHASAGAHLPALWDKMQPNLAIVTPFKQAIKTNPPRPEMLDVLAQRTRVVLTSPPSWQTPKRKPHVKNGALNITLPPSHHVRHNAVAVALASNGTIVREVLAGQAALYPRSTVRSSKTPPRTRRPRGRP